MTQEHFKKKCPVVRAAEAGALYLHVPFCPAKCRYCDFYSLPPAPSQAESYVRAMARELAMARSSLRPPLASVFVGGGTPTSIGPRLLGDLLSPLGPLLGDHTEFTVEANPGSIDDSVCGVLRGAGVNRVSLGVQSFNDDELRFLGRLHSADQAQEALAMLRRSGFTNICTDLIYGIPGQTMDTWRATLEQALQLDISHLSCYALSIEAGTPLWDSLQAGSVSPVEDELQRAQYELAIRLAADAGFQHYEISNFALPGCQCRQNLTYWRNEPYVGIGPAAASYVGGIRSTNRADLNAWQTALLSSQKPPAASERLTGRAEMGETIMLALRMIGGLDRSAFKRRFGRDIADAFPQTTNRYARQGAIVVTPSRVRFSRDTLFVADTVLAEFLAEARGKL